LNAIYANWRFDRLRSAFFEFFGSFCLEFIWESDARGALATLLSSQVECAFLEITSIVRERSGERQFAHSGHPSGREFAQETTKVSGSGYKISELTVETLVQGFKGFIEQLSPRKTESELQKRAKGQSGATSASFYCRKNRERAVRSLQREN
jgi:hypothetical protein